MKFCGDHWTALRAAIDERGLTRFVSGTGAALTDRLKQDLVQPEQTKETFDPLANATWAIYTNALDAGGLYLMSGDLCPLCEAEAHGIEKGSWITLAADEQVDRARTLGLIPEVV